MESNNKKQERKYYKIGDTFMYNGVKLKVEFNPGCTGCHFYNGNEICLKTDLSMPACVALKRKDNTPVIFRKIE